MVDGYIWGVEVGGSNPSIPTRTVKNKLSTAELFLIELTEFVGCVGEATLAGNVNL